MSTLMDTWLDAQKKSDFKVLLSNKDLASLAKSLSQFLANRQIIFRDFNAFDKKKDELKKPYLDAAQNVLKEGQALQAKLAAHPKALAELTNFLELIDSESDYELTDFSPGVLNLSTSNPAKALKLWDDSVVPAIKSHGIAPALAVSACKMHALLAKLIDLLKPIQEASRSVIGLNAQITKWDISVKATMDKLTNSLKSWKDKAQLPNAQKMVKIIEDIKHKVSLQEI